MLFIVAAAVLSAQSSAFRLTVDHAFGLTAPFSRRCELDVDTSRAPVAYSFKNATADGSGSLSLSQLAELAAAAEADGVYRLRVTAAAGPSGAAVEALPPVYASVRACALVASELAHNIRFLLDAPLPAAEGAGPADPPRSSSSGSGSGSGSGSSSFALRGADLQLAQPRGFAGCAGRRGVPAGAWSALQKRLGSAAKAPAAVVGGGDGGGDRVFLTSRFGAIGVEEALAIPVSLPPLAAASGGAAGSVGAAAMPGAPYPGQRAFTEADVTAALAGPGGGAAAGGGGAAAALLGQGQGQQEAPKSFLERNWMMILVGIVWLLMRSVGGEEEPAQGQGRRGGGGSGASGGASGGGGGGGGGAGAGAGGAR